MSYETHWLQPHDEQRSRLDTGLWRGVTNGLPAIRWAPILDVAADDVMPLLAALAVQGIAAHADVFGRPVRARRAAPPRWRIWVDATAHARAEDVLRSELSATVTTGRSKIGTQWIGPDEQAPVASRAEVIVAYDGPPACRRALEVACVLAAHSGHQVRAIVATRRSPRYGETMAETKEALTRAERAGRRLCNEVEAVCHEHGVTVRVSVRPGSATAELHRALRSDTSDASIVVSATFGLPGRGWWAL